LLILDEIMRRVQHDLKLIETPRPCDYFDLIGGTSTGGLIALMLGRLQMTTNEALRTYNSLARAIFSRDNKKWLGQDGAFKATTLEEKVQEVVSKRGLGELMLDPSHQSRKGKAFVCAVPANSMAHPRRFRTYPVRALASANCRIWEAARATTAAPTFFKRIAIGEEGQAKEEFIDGGLGCNNPATQVLEEARNVFGNNRSIRCLISIGTGHPGTIGLAKPDAFQKVLPTKLIDVLKKIATGCEETANGLSARFKDLEKFYFRFNVAHGAEGISLEEWDKIGKLTEHTKAYMADVSVSKAIDEVVDMLCNPGQVGATLGSVCQSL
jgi:predicted acylesterase/phospholipase RssA